jgi:uncharacterized membrane protein YgdD (TMEM256/DUF423 family)
VTAVARFLLASGAIALAIAVAGGAYAAHAVKDAAHADARQLLQTATLYMFVHGLGILVAGVLARAAASEWLLAAGVLHLAGIVLFCGSLWVLALAGRSLGVAPIGGVAFILGWLCLAAYAFRHL